MCRHFARLQIRKAVNGLIVPDVSNIQKARIGSPALVYRPEKKKWEGPFSILEFNSKYMTVLLPTLRVLKIQIDCGETISRSKRIIKQTVRKCKYFEYV